MGIGDVPKSFSSGQVYADRWVGYHGPGEVMFAPGGAAHGVRNVRAGVSFAVNFVDESDRSCGLSFFLGRPISVRKYCKASSVKTCMPKD